MSEVYYWKTKEFKTAQAMRDWLAKNEHKVQWRPVFINNAWGLEYKPLRKIL